MFWHSKHLHAPSQHGSGGWRTGPDSPEIRELLWDLRDKSWDTAELPPLPQSVLRQELRRFVAFKLQFLCVFVDTAMQKITSFNIPLVSRE